MKDENKLIEELINESKEVKENLKLQMVNIKKAADFIEEAFVSGNKVLIFGNGGSAADSQHFAAELAGRFKIDRPALPALALTTNTSTITAVSNDLGYEEVFSRQVEAYAEGGDVVIGISTSGNSKNVIKGLEAAGKYGCRTIGLGGTDAGQMSSQCSFAITVPSDETARIQEAHILIIHIICELVEKRLFENDKEDTGSFVV